LTPRDVYETLGDSSITLGCTQIAISFAVNLLIALSAAKLAAWFLRHPRWLALQRYFMRFALAGLAVRIAAEKRGAA
jgi:threonine/homoserine/homoserine lactone efflux protein